MKDDMKYSAQHNYQAEAPSHGIMNVEIHHNITDWSARLQLVALHAHETFASMVSQAKASQHSKKHEAYLFVWSRV